jgi:hypothetical protein
LTIAFSNSDQRCDVAGHVWDTTTLAWVKAQQAIIHTAALSVALAGVASETTLVGIDTVLDDIYARTATDVDDDNIANSQSLPLNIVENYVHSKTTGAWVRMQGTDTGYLFTRPVGIYTPNGELAMDDTADAVKSLMLGKTGTSTYQTPRLDKYTHAFVMMDYVHHEIHDGHAYMYHDVIDSLAANVSQDYMITTPNTAAWLHVFHDVEFSGAGTVEIFEAGDRVGTTEQTMYNRDRNNTTAPTGTLHKGTSGGLTDGTKIVYWKGGANQSKNTAAHGTPSEKILKQNTKYIIRVTSRAEANIVSVSIGWYEHTNLTA